MAVAVVRLDTVKEDEGIIIFWWMQHGLKCDAMWYHVMSHYVVQSNPIQSNSIQSNPIQANPIQSNPIQSNPIQSNVLSYDMAWHDALRYREAQYYTLATHNSLGSQNSNTPIHSKALTYPVLKCTALAVLFYRILRIMTYSDSNKHDTALLLRVKWCNLCDDVCVL